MVRGKQNVTHIRMCRVVKVDCEDGELSIFCRGRRAVPSLLVVLEAKTMVSMKMVAR